MRNMFYNAHVFNCDLSKWDVSNVYCMQGMFYDAKCFDCDLSKWYSKKWEQRSDCWGPALVCNMMFGGDKVVFSGRLHPHILRQLRVGDPRSNFCRNGRWLWRLAREGIRPHVLARLAAYHMMELGARPDREGNAPRGAIEAFREDFRSVVVVVVRVVCVCVRPIVYR